MQEEMRYLCIDLKSFYASVECCDRGLDPMTTRLVVADGSRTDKTICLAVSPAMKALGVRNRCRVFEIPPGIDYIMAPPRMSRYIERSADIYSVYLSYVSKDDIHVYSIDEAFLDVGPYLSLYGMDAKELGLEIRKSILEATGIPAAVGVGTNLYLAKVALDITAKKSDDFVGVLDERAYKDELWTHTPLTDFWRVGPATQRKLAELGIHTMGQLAVAPEEPLYEVFGIDAEILIDHAWGIEPVRMCDIKGYRSHSQSLSSAQVLPHGYNYEGGLLIAKEMADKLCLELVEKGLEAATVGVWVSHEITREELERRKELAGDGGKAEVRRARAGLSEGATVRLASLTSSAREVRHAVERAYLGSVTRDLPIRRVGVGLGEVREREASGTQLDLFSSREEREGEQARQEAINSIKRRFGKNAILRGMDLLPDATARERNEQIGGHRSGE